MSSVRDRGRAALTLVGLSLVLVVVTGLLGPSAAQPPLPQRRPHPPYSLDLDPSPWVVTTLLLGAMLAGAAALWVGLGALRAGWAPSPRRLLAGSAVAAAAMVAVPPMGSADHLVYAAYGRILATGGNPYVDTAADLAAADDPIGRAVEPPWQEVPSIYGPLATAQQWFAATVGAGSTHTTVFVLAVLGALAFVVTGLALQRLAGPGREARARAALLWSLNPLLLYEVVGGAHVDGFGVVWAAAALLAVRRTAFVAGVLVALAGAVKLSFGLYALALVFALRREPRRLAALVAGCALAGAATYLPALPHVFDQLRAASRFVSFASPWRLTVGPLEAVLDDDLARAVVGVAAWVLIATLVWLLARSRLVVPVADDDRVGRDAVAAAAVLTVVWILAAPYSLPWYDVAAWAPVAVLAASRLDPLLIARTTVLAAAYVPGRVVELPAGLDLLARHLRGTVAPVIGVILLVVLVRLCRSGPTVRRGPPWRVSAESRPSARPPGSGPRSR